MFEHILDWGLAGDWLGIGWGLAILLYLSVRLISASEMSKIAKTFNDFWRGAPKPRF